MKGQKASRIGIVVADEMLRAAQWVDGKLVTSSVAAGKDLKKSLRQLLTSSPFVGRDTVVGLEGASVLIESLVVPAGVSKSAKAVCAERLKGDPVFHEQAAALGVAVANPPTGAGPSLVILAAILRERVAEIMQSCRELELRVHAVEAAALSSWRAWNGEGLQVRLLRSRKCDVVLAGTDGKPLFCRVVEAPISSMELRATVTRAAQLLGTSGFPKLETSGIEVEQARRLGADLGIAVEPTGVGIVDPAAQGLASEGVILTEFTPPEERTLREQRRTRKVSTAVAMAGAVVILIAGVLGYGRISELSEQKRGLEEAARSADQARMELATQQAELARLQSVDVTLTEARPGHRMSRLWELIVNAAPEHLLLDSVDIKDLPQDAPKPKQAGAKAPPATGRMLEIRLNGLAGDAYDVRRYMDNLLDSGAFTDVRQEGSERVLLGNGRGGEGERFRIYARAETR